MRIWFFTGYFSWSPGMISQTPGKGAKYAVGFVGSQNNPLTGDNNYRINLPANIPAGNFWSATLYEAENASGLANGQPFPSLGSRDKLLLGRRAAGWQPQSARGYFVILRVYGHAEATIDKTWTPGDVEKQYFARERHPPNYT